jgi:hypothetical protein
MCYGTKRCILNIICTILFMLILVLAIIFYCFRNYSIELSLNGTVTQQECTRHCETNAQNVELCFIGGYVTLNYTYEGSLYSVQTPSIPCCGATCCQDLVISQKPVWIMFGKGGIDPENVLTFSCTPQYNNHIYFLLSIVFFCIFLICISPIAGLWIIYLAPKKPIEKDFDSTPLIQ